MVAGRHPRPYTLKDFILNTGGQKREGRTLLPWLLVTGSDSPVRDDSSTLIGSNAPCSCTQQGHASKRGQHAQQGHMPAFNSRIILRGHEKQASRYCEKTQGHSKRCIPDNAEALVRGLEGDPPQRLLG